MVSFFSWLERERDEDPSLDAERHRYFSELATIWKVAVPSLEPKVPHLSDVWAELAPRLDPGVEQRVFKRRWLTACAVAAAILFFAGWRWLAPLLPGASGIYETGRGERRTVVLRDGSSAVLNADSRIKTWPMKSGRERVVTLEGEAEFAVVAGMRPFVVKTDIAEIRVLGTRFNVYARGRLEVAVREGVVEVAVPAVGKPRRVLVERGQMIKYTGAALGPPKQLKYLGYPGWRQGELALDQTPLSWVCQEIERRYDVSIELADTLPNDLKVTGLFTDRDPEALVSALCVLLNRVYRVERGVFVIE